MAGERPTTEITTPGGFKVVLKSYMTGREHAQLQDVFLKRMEIKSLNQVAGNASAEISGLQGSAASEAQELTFKLMVVSVDGSTDDVLNKVLDMPMQDTKAVREAIEEITDGKKK